MGWTGQMGRQGHTDLAEAEEELGICLGNSGNGMYPEPAATGAFWAFWAFWAQGLEQQEQPRLPVPALDVGTVG